MDLENVSAGERSHGFVGAQPSLERPFRAQKFKTNHYLARCGLGRELSGPLCPGAVRGQAFSLAKTTTSQKAIENGRGSNCDLPPDPYLFQFKSLGLLSLLILPF